MSCTTAVITKVPNEFDYELYKSELISTRENYSEKDMKKWFDILSEEWNSGYTEEHYKGGGAWGPIEALLKQVTVITKWDHDPGEDYYVKVV